MRRFLAAGIVLLFVFGVILPAQENPTESSNLYDRMGVITERGLHGAVPEENIDLFSGSLVLKNLDITLPGPNGFDLNIWRVYNSKVNTEYTDTTYSYPQQETSSWVGYGWSMHMGRILNPDSSNPVIEFPDGRQESTYPWIHEVGILITRNFLKLKKFNPDYGGHHTVHFQDGTVWIFGAAATLWLKGAQVPVALVTKIENSYGHEINIEYYPGTSKLMQITDALGRLVLFNLDGGGNLDSITVPHEDGTVTYEYTVVTPAWDDTAFSKLAEMQPPVLNPVTYGYDATSKELNQVTTSYGGTITYTFADQSFKYFDDTMRTRSLSSKTIQFSAGNSATWNYVYGDYSGIYTLLIKNLETGLLDKEVNGGFALVYGPESIERVWFFGPQPESDYGWLSGLLAIKEIIKKDGSTSIANTQYVKEPEQISTEIIYVRGQSWGPAAAALEVGGYQTKIGTASQYTQIQFTDPALRKYGLPSGVVVAAPYDIASLGSTQKSSVLKSQPAKKMFSMSGAATSLKSTTQETESFTLYTRFRKVLQYAFIGNTDFAERNMLSLLSMEAILDQEDTQYKSTLWEYFSNGAVQKVRRWKAGGVVLDWVYTYDESSGYPTDITITIDPPGVASGIETRIYRNGTLARVEKPGYVEYDRTIYADGLIQTETNQHGGTMTFTYDDIGRITNIAMPSGFNPISASWSQNSVAISRGGNILTKYWDGMGRNLGFEETGASVTLYSRRTLDGESRVTAESKGAVNSNHKTVFELNENGQPLQVTDATGKWTKFSYVDNTCTIIDMKNNQKVLTYSHLPGLVTRVVQENTQTDSYYKGENRLYLVESSAVGLDTRTHLYYQNGLDQLDQEYHPETGTINYSYNDEGNLASKTWGGATLSYTYNASNQLKTESDGEETITFNYDANGRVQEIVSSTSQWRRYDIAYNTLGAVTSEKQAIDGGLVVADKTVGYHYDGNGLLDEITYPDGRKAAYSNNTLLLPESLSFNSEANRISGVTYGVNKQPLGYTLGNGAVFAANYDYAGRIKTSGLSNGGITLLGTTYGYDDVGNINSLTNTTPAANASFQYDAFNRLTKATYPEKVYDYEYDPFGNMLAAQESGVTVFNKTYTAGNRISGYGYDARGNLTQDGSFAQVWDKRNRMSESRTATNALLGSYVYNERGLRVKAERSAQSSVQVVAPNGGESLYLGALDTISWNGMGLAGALVKLELLVGGAVAGTIVENLPGTQTSYQWQVGKTLTGTVNPGTEYKVRVTAIVPPATSGATYYFYDSGGKLLAEYDGTGACVKDYLYLGGKMIGEYQPVTGTYYYFASDQINSTRLVTDAAGAVVHSAQYDPYGGLYKTWIDTYHPKPGFSGKEREFGSEMDYFGARYYGHKQYRFLSVDPEMNKIETMINPQLWNLYAYCRNNPITFFDPNGEASFKVDVTFRFCSLPPFKLGGTGIDKKNIITNVTRENGNVKSLEVSVKLDIAIRDRDSWLWLLPTSNMYLTFFHELGHLNDIEKWGKDIIDKIEKRAIKENLFDQEIKFSVESGLAEVASKSIRKRDGLINEIKDSISTLIFNWETIKK